jgi:D-proline reductase (dithiol) PrdB
MLHEVANRVAVQLYKHVPWIAERWARRHRFIESETVPWAALRRPVRQSVVALVTTAGVHVRADRRFDMADPDGDPSFRILPSDTPAAELAITHKYYDHSAADRDINVVLPVDRLRELQYAGQVGGIAPFHYSFMGHIDGPHIKTLMEQTGPEVARRLRTDGADVVFLTPA